jgi:hypothetical protein
MAEPFSSLSTSITFNEIEDILVKYATRIALDAEKNLRSNKNGKDSNASGSLADSIKISPVEYFGSNYSIEISMLDYWDYVNDGTRGRINGLPNRKNPPVSDIIKWIKDKQLRLDDKGVTKRGYKREGTLISSSKKKVKMGNKQVSILEATAYKIAAKIGKYGTKGTDFLTDAIDDNTEGLIKELKLAGKKDIIIQIKR